MYHVVKEKAIFWCKYILENIHILMHTNPDSTSESKKKILKKYKKIQNFLKYKHVGMYVFM